MLLLVVSVCAFQESSGACLGTSDSRYSTRTSLAPTLKFVQWSVLKLLMPHGLREGLKALSLLLLGYKWTYKRVAKCSAVLCGLPDESNVSPVNSKF